MNFLDSTAKPGNARMARTRDGDPESPRGLRCLIADRSVIFALGLKATLESASMTVVGWVDEPSRVASVALWEPVDVVLACYEPPVDAMYVARTVQSCAVLVLSSVVGDEFISDVARAGARGILRKQASQQDVIDAVCRVARGETVLSGVSADALPRMVEGSERGRTGAQVLSKREQQVIHELVRGYSNKQVARELGIAEQTVKNHVSHIMAKLGLSTRVQLCRWALEPTVAVQESDGSLR